MLNTSSRETVIETGARSEPGIELNLSTEQAQNKLAAFYAKGWQIRRTAVRTLTFEIEREGKAIRLDSESLTFYAIKI